MAAKKARRRNRKTGTVRAKSSARRSQRKRTRSVRRSARGVRRSARSVKRSARKVARKVALAGVFALATTGAAAQREDGLSTPGALIARLEDGSARELPLMHTDVRVEISAFVARTVVEQTFRNVLSEPVDAVYAFPLGHEAAVDDFELHAGEQVIRGEIHRREEARRIYEEAREQGQAVRDALQDAAGQQSGAD